MIAEFDGARLPLKDELAPVLEFMYLVFPLDSEESDIEELSPFECPLRGNVPSACTFLDIPGGSDCGALGTGGGRVAGMLGTAGGRVFGSAGLLSSGVLGCELDGAAGGFNDGGSTDVGGWSLGCGEVGRLGCGGE